MHKKKFIYSDSRKVSKLVSKKLDPHKIIAQEIGPAYLEYRRMWDDAKAFKNLPSFPIHVDYEMKFKCNLRCPFCLMSLPDEKRSAYGDSSKNLNPQFIVEQIKEGVYAGQKALGFGGLWEPLLEDDLPEIIAQARQSGIIDIMFNTNGLLLNEKKSLALMKAGLTKLMISVDAATENTYDKMRIGSDFKTLTANIENFLALRRSLGRVLPLVRLSFCRTALNEHELDAFLERWHDVADFFSIQTYGRYESAAPPDFPEVKIEQAPSGPCAQASKRLLLRHNGDVLPCCDASGLSLVMGNIASQSLADIWNNTLIKNLRSSQKSGPLLLSCQSCQGKFE